MLRNALRLMRGPARAAGLAEVQRSLETGFDVFRAMKGAQEFIALIDARERALAAPCSPRGAATAIRRWSSAGRSGADDGGSRLTRRLRHAPRFEASLLAHSLD